MLRRTSMFLALAVTAAALATTAPVAAQNSAEDMERLEARRDELTVELNTLDAELETLAGRIDELEAELATRRAEIELVADDLEVAAWARIEPAATRLQIALVGFTQGDPRHNELLDEIRTLEGDDEPARRRELYESVIDDTTTRLAIIDDRLRELSDDLVTDRKQRDTTATALADAKTARDESGARRSELATELADVTARIEELQLLRNRAVLTGLNSFDDPTRPALAVKIDNVRDAMPQAGINQADIVFVEEVEGGLTRLAAVFHSTGADEVGPVRSMRTGDFDLLGQLNGPLFSNSGGNRGARGALAGSTLVNVGIDALPSSYYRDPTRRSPHNLFTNPFNLWSLGAALPGTGTPSPLFQFRTEAAGLPAGAAPVSTIAIDYGSARVDYQWNGSSWDRSQDGRPTVDADGVRTSPTTVVVQFVDYRASAADRASPEAVSIGSGDAWIFTDGHVVRGGWIRTGLTEATHYVYAGTFDQVPILPGRTWIELPRPGRASTG